MPTERDVPVTSLPSLLSTLPKYATAPTLSMASTSTAMVCPGSDFTPYPLGTKYLQTVALGANSTSPLIFPVAIHLTISVKSDFRAVRTFMASGSPNLALISMILGPSLVSMNCPYMVPL